MRMLLILILMLTLLFGCSTMPRPPLSSCGRGGDLVVIAPTP